METLTNIENNKVDGLTTGQIITTGDPDDTYGKTISKIKTPENAVTHDDITKPWTWTAREVNIRTQRLVTGPKCETRKNTATSHDIIKSLTKPWREKDIMHATTFSMFHLLFN